MQSCEAQVAMVKSAVTVAASMAVRLTRVLVKVFMLAQLRRESFCNKLASWQVGEASIVEGKGWRVHSPAHRQKVFML